MCFFLNFLVVRLGVPRFLKVDVVIFNTINIDIKLKVIETGERAEYIYTIGPLHRDLFFLLSFSCSYFFIVRGLKRWGGVKGWVKKGVENRGMALKFKYLFLSIFMSQSFITYSVVYIVCVYIGLYTTAAGMKEKY